MKTMIEEEQEKVVQGPGQILQEARKKAGLSTKEIADKLRLKTLIIENIEQDNYDTTISLTFIRGYLKLYAKHVHVSEEQVLAAFDKLNTQNKEPAKLQSFSRRIANQANDDKLMLVTYFILTVVIALVVIWWFQQSTSDSSAVVTEVDTPSIQPSVQDNEPAPKPKDIVTESTPVLDESVGENAASFDIQPVVVEQLESNEPELNAPDLAATSSSEQLTNEPEVLEEPTDIGVEQVVESPQPVELVFEFSGDCWMNLSDASGENIAYGVKVKGRVMPVTGIPPFEVTLGAPEVVQIRYDGEPLDMSFLTPGRIAKFDLPLSE